MINNLIGVSGKISSGKDLVTKIIQYITYKDNPSWEDYQNNYHDKEFDFTPRYKNIKFADKIKDITCLLLGCTREELEDREFKEKELGEEWWSYQASSGALFPYLTYLGDVSQFKLVKLTPRKLMQLLGTECGRYVIHPNIWINATFADYKPQHVRDVKYQGLFIENLTTMPNWIISDVRFPNEAKSIKDRGGVLIRIIRPLTDSKIISNHESENALDYYNDWDYVINNDGSIEDLYHKVEIVLGSDLQNISW